MIFSSIPFIFAFLPIALIGFHLCNLAGAKIGAAWLVACSFYFYGYWNPSYLVLLIGSICWNYLLGGLMFAQPPERERRRLVLLWIGIGGNLALLGYYKYWFPVIGFFAAHHLAPAAWESRILLPLGISFFTFTQIGYLVDSHDGCAKERGPLSYLLFVTFFPHLIAGPILHNREIMPQFSDRETYRFRLDNLGIGMAIFIVGLSKKVLIADPLGFTADRAFQHTGELGTLDSWTGSLSYLFQLYFDFSGYSDMAIGLARMFNVVFPANFDSPYKATSVIDYWARWHMTLTRYLTLYLFNPVAMRVARSRVERGLPTSKKALKKIPVFLMMLGLPTFFTMGLAGVWHGAGLQFVIFGLLHASYITIVHAWRVFGPRERQGWHFVIPSFLLTACAVLVGDVFFRAYSAGDAVQMLTGMAGARADVGAALSTPTTWLRIGGCFLICLLLPNTQQIMRDFNPVLDKIAPVGARFGFIRFRPSVLWGLGLGVMFVIAIIRASDVSKFLYFDF